jgi:hypothetical protein
MDSQAPSSRVPSGVESSSVSAAVRRRWCAGGGQREDAAAELAEAIADLDLQELWALVRRDL